MRKTAGKTQWAERFALALMLAVALGVTAYASDGTQDLVAQGSDTVTITNPVDSEAPWTYDQAKSTAHGATVYVAGNSGENNRVAGVSNIALTVTGPGKLTFDYLVDTPEDDMLGMYDEGEYYGLIYQIGAPVSASNYKTATNMNDDWPSRFSIHSDAWRTAEVQVADEGKTTVYIAYYRSGDDSRSSDPTDENYVAISNVKFDSGKKTLTVDADLAYGGVTAGETSVTSDANSFSYAAGTSVELTATASDGNTFYGWTEGDALLSLDPTITVKLDDSRNIRAVFAPKGTYAARIDGKFYTDDDGGLEQALKDATDGDTVVMLADQELSQSATVPKGVTLLLACAADDAGYVPGQDSKEFGPSSTYNKNDASHQVLYSTLTIPENVTLTVEGSVLVNAVTGVANVGGNDQGLINGNYSQIDLNGVIAVEGGILENYGKITGKGQVTATNGANIGDRYEVPHWRGGSYSVPASGQWIYPMLEADCHAIETTVTMDSSSSFYGLVKMYETYGGYHDARFQLVGGQDSNAMIRLYADSTMSKVYSDSRTTLTLTGGAEFAGSSMSVAGTEVATSDYVFPVDGDIDLVLSGGKYYVTESFKLLPGCTVRVTDQATVTVSEDKTLVAYKQGVFTTVNYVGYYYSVTEYDATRPTATITLDGGTTLTVLGSFAGTVQNGDGCTTDSPATLDLSSAQAYKSVDTKEMNDTSTSTTVTTTTVLEGVTTVVKKTYTNDGAGWSVAQTERIYGDADGNGEVTLADISAILVNLGQTGQNVYGDADGNGEVTLADISAVLVNLGNKKS